MTELERKQMEAAAARDFILAGNARVTFKSVKTGDHFTFRIKKAKPAEGSTRQIPEVWFVSVMYDYESDGYQYLGIIRNGKFGASLKSQNMKSAPSYKCFSWSWEHLDHENLEVWHEGRCGRCGRALTDPQSIESGYGPECRRKV